MATRSVQIDFNANLAKFEKGINKATSRLNAFQRNAKHQTSLMSGAFSKLGLKVAGIFGGLAAGNVFIQTTRDIEKLKASLVSVTGSAENAQRAFNLIESFASTTPFSVQELTTAFTKLTALGLKPSEEALTSFGNTASAMGKSLDQFVEAVADAVTGEFERLKEFGIKASSQGEKVAFTFQGVTQTVKKNAQEIEGYLRTIGDVQFAGAMERQAATLDGAFSNAGDAIDRLIVQLGESGLNGVLKDSVKWFTELTNSTTKWLDSFRDIENRTNLKALNDELFEAQERLDSLLTPQKNTGLLGRFGSYDIEIKNTLDTINKLHKRLGELEAPEIKPEGIDETTTAVTKTQAALEKANESGKALGVTLKSLEQIGGPFGNFSSDAAKIHKTYTLLNAALNISRGGSGDAAASIEKAAAAINKLNEGGLVADQTIRDMKRSLSEAIDSKDKPEIKLLTSIDENGLRSMTDEATKKEQERLDKNPLIWRAVLDVTALNDQINDAQAGADITSEQEGGRL